MRAALLAVLKMLDDLRNRLSLRGAAAHDEDGVIARKRACNTFELRGIPKRRQRRSRFREESL